MHYSSLNFLRLADVPEILAQITTGTTDNRHLGMVLVMADRAFPFVVVINGNFAVKAADMAVIRLGVEFSVLNIVIDEFNNLFQCFQIMAHVRNFYIRNCATGGNVLELAFKFKLAEGINMLTHVDMIGVGIIAFVRNVLN